MSKNVKIVH